jgi:hypothetical protein
MRMLRSEENGSGDEGGVLSAYTVPASAIAPLRSDQVPAVRKILQPV